MAARKWDKSVAGVVRGSRGGSGSRGRRNSRYSSSHMEEEVVPEEVARDVRKRKL